MQATPKYIATANDKRRGFTIVELLIVIVVIGILAAITIVAYNGVQQRAKTAAITSAVDQWEKIIRMQAATDKEALELAYRGVGYSCLGHAEDFPAENGFPAGVCIAYLRTTDGSYFGHSGIYREVSPNPWTMSLPHGKLPITEGVLDHGGASRRIRARGVAVNFPSHGTGFQLQWVPQMVGECGRGEALISAVDGVSIGGSLCTLNVAL